MICRACGGLCVTRQRQEADEAAAALRTRGMGDELATILRYPLSDPVAFGLLALAIAALGVLARLALFAGGYVALLREGLLLAYAATALERTSNGRLEGFLPDLVNLADFARPILLSVAALAVSAGPLIAVVLTHPELRRDPLGALAAGVPGTGSAALAALWLLGYLPIALLVAGTSGELGKTLNPVLGLLSIRRMGTLYWHTAGIFAALVLARLLLGGLFAVLPLGSTLLAAAADSYLSLALGCAIGLAIYKRAFELGLEAGGMA